MGPKRPVLKRAESAQSSARACGDDSDTDDETAHEAPSLAVLGRLQDVFFDLLASLANDLETRNLLNPRFRAQLTKGWIVHRVLPFH